MINCPQIDVLLQNEVNPSVHNSAQIYRQGGNIDLCPEHSIKNLKTHLWLQVHNVVLVYVCGGAFMCMCVNERFPALRAISL